MKKEIIPFKLVSNYKPTGDQPKAITDLVEGIEKNKNKQTLLGVTGSGKTFTIANVIQKVQKPTLIIAHNKTLAAQLFEEFREFFPENRVEYFISYYDYYMPESYIPSKDQYIEKDMSINPRIEMMRHAATASLLSRDDVIIVASVSCIYGLSDPKVYGKMGIDLNVGQRIGRKKLLQKLISILFERNEMELMPGRVRVKGDTVDFIPSYQSNIIRVEFFGDEIERISEIDKNTGDKLQDLKYFFVYPASNYVIPEAEFERAIKDIRLQLELDLKEIEDPLINHRLKQRTNYDMEMLKETGACKGVENYSRHFDNRKEGEKAFCLLDYFAADKRDFLIIIDESHRTIPQIGAMYNGDRSRKANLIDYGFRLTSAFDNRPLKFEEFSEYMDKNKVVFVSATPANYEYSESDSIVEQIIRPTGLIDPGVEVRKVSPKDIISNTILVHGANPKNKERIKAENYIPPNEKGWIGWIKKELESKKLKIDAPLMPQSWDPKYKHWKNEFEKMKIDENSILVGTSTGGAFLVRWLEDTQKKIKKLILVAPVTGKENCNEWLSEFGDFKIGPEIKKNIEEIVVFISNDKIERIESAKFYTEKLDGKLIELEGRGHFTEKQMKTNEFPELIDEILKAATKYGGQVKDIMSEIKKTTKKGNRVLVTTLTKKLAEEITDFFSEKGIKTRYMHAEIDALERTEILRELRLGKFDVLVGINLLREGIDIPEIGLVGILDADKEGFLRDAKSLIQIIGRAARNSEAKVILYADKKTESIKEALRETGRRRRIQMEYNEKNGIIPKTIIKPVREKQVEVKDTKHIPKAEIPNLIIELEADMKQAAEELDFERAIALREKLRKLEERLN